MRRHVILCALALTCGLTRCGESPKTKGDKPAAGATGLDRTALPIREPDYPRATELDARNATPPPRFA